MFPEFAFTDFHTGIAQTVSYYESVFQLQAQVLCTVALQNSLPAAVLEQQLLERRA